jgi:hypothetical protein
VEGIFFFLSSELGLFAFRMIKNALLILGLLTTNAIWCQSAFKFFVPVSMDVGLVLSKKISTTTEGWSAGIGTAVNLNAGGSILFKDRIGLRAEIGALFFTANYFKEDISYSVLSLYTHPSITPFVLFPTKNHGTTVHLGCQFGSMFYGVDELKNTEEEYEAITQSTVASPNYFSPEIGLTRFDGRHTFSILGTYFYQSFKDPLVITEITDENGVFKGACKGDYLGLRVAFAFRIGGKVETSLPKPFYIDSPDESQNFASRDNAVIKQIKTGRKFIKLRLYESGEIDNDTISVSVNGRYILTDHNLEKKKVKLRIPLEKGTNTITVYAHNEGTLPPNTASCYIRHGLRRSTFPVSTSLKRNASILVERK